MLVDMSGSIALVYRNAQDTNAERERERERQRQTDRETDRQRQTDRQTDRDRQTERFGGFFSSRARILGGENVRQFISRLRFFLSFF